MLRSTNWKYMKHYKNTLIFKAFLKLFWMSGLSLPIIYMWIRFFSTQILSHGQSRSSVEKLPLRRFIEDKMSGQIHCTIQTILQTMYGGGGGDMGPSGQSAASLLVGFENKLQNGCQPTVYFLVKYLENIKISQVWISWLVTRGLTVYFLVNTCKILKYLRSESAGSTQEDSLYLFL